MTYRDRLSLAVIKARALYSKINWGFVLLLVIFLWFLIPNLTPGGLKCWQMGGRPDIDFSCRKVTVTIIEVK